MSFSANSTYLFFRVFDFTNTNVLTSYTLEELPLNFSPDFSTCPLLSSARSISNKILRWDFGDGTFSTNLSATHSYNWPGQYQVRLTVFDQNGVAYDSSYSPTIQVYDLVPTLIEFTPTDTATITASNVIGPLRVNIYNSWQSYPPLSSTGYTVNFYASGASNNNITNINFNNNKWTHLCPSNRFLAIETQNELQQFVSINALTATQTKIYASAQNNQLQLCNESDAGSIFIGTSGFCDVYFTDDSVKTSPTNLFASFDSSKFHDYLVQKNNLFNYITPPPHGFQNLTPASYTYSKSNYNPATRIAFSTTGITGEGNLSSTSFDIPGISWQYTQIPFVITLKDKDNYTTKFYPPLSSSMITDTSAATAYDVQIGVVYLSGGTLYPLLSGIQFYEDFTSETPQSLGSFYKGYFSSSNTVENCALTASVVITDLTSSYTITGTSNTFNIYTTGGKFNIAKINEDWDAEGFYLSLRYQENLYDKEKFFKDFLGEIVGDANAYPYELGKTVYEKIANFVDNKANIDRVNIDALLALCKELSIQFEQYSYNYPPKLRRVVDILSTKQKVIWGSENKYNLSFNLGNNVITDITKGINLGSEISPLTGTVITNTPIVAYELFSGNYTLVNTINNIYDPGTSSFIPPSTIVPLSTYSFDWGWGLIAPTNLSGIAIANYYKFYEYIDTSADAPTFFDNVIDWTNSYTTLTPTQSSYKDWTDDDGIMQTMLSYELTQGLDLFTSAVRIALS